jgi:hypothetical protein
MSRFGDGEYKVHASGRPLQLFDSDFVSSNSSIKEIVLAAIPGFPRNVADIFEQTVKDHLTFDVEAREFITINNLTQEEAEAICWWTGDVSTMSGMPSNQSPFYVYNSDLRARDASKIKMWQDFSYYFLKGLAKLPPVKATSFRGEKKRVTELSKQYAKDNQVHTDIARRRYFMDGLLFLVDALIINLCHRSRGYHSIRRRPTAITPCNSLAPAEHSSRF